MITPDDELGHWQRLQVPSSATPETSPRPRPPTGITPPGRGDPRQADLFADDGPPAGVPADVARMFEAYAVEIAGRGFSKYSADAIGHRIRWHEQVERGNRDFKVNDHWIRPMAVWFLARHPELPEFFELRERDVTKLTERDAA